jgi:hemerythrin
MVVLFMLEVAADLRDKMVDKEHQELVSLLQNTLLKDNVAAAQDVILEIQE